MKTKMIAFALVASVLAFPAAAAEMAMRQFKSHGHMISVHQMKMDDGTMMYAMSANDVSRLLATRTKMFTESFGH